MTSDHHRLNADLTKDSVVAPKLSFAFYGRVSTEDNQDPESSRRWQLSLANNLISPHGATITASTSTSARAGRCPGNAAPRPADC